MFGLAGGVLSCAEGTEGQARPPLGQAGPRAESWLRSCLSRLGRAWPGTRKAEDEGWGGVPHRIQALFLPLNWSFG